MMINNRIIIFIPLLLTLCNAFCGLFGTMIAILACINHQLNYFTLTFYSVFFCLSFDIADGMVARKLNVTSKIGAELDSLCDAISFGFVPALLLPIIVWCVTNDVNKICLAMTSSLIYLSAVLYRLARFNVMEPQNKEDDKWHGHLFFQGMPSPGGALLVTMSCFVYLHYSLLLVIPLLIYLLAAYLMVAKINYPDLPKHYFYKIRTLYELIPFVIIFFYLNFLTAVFAFLLYYAILPILNKIYTYLKQELC